MISYTGIETISNMAEEARNPRRLIPRSMSFVVLAVMVIYAGLPAVALSAMPVTETADGFTTELADTYAGDPILGVVENMDLGVFQTAVRVLRRDPGGDDPADRVERRDHRRQPADLLDGPAPAASRPPAPHQPAFRTPATAILVFGLIACLVMIPGQAEFLGTLYAFGAMLSFTIAHVALIGAALAARAQPDAQDPGRRRGRRRRRPGTGRRSTCAFAASTCRCSR